MSQRMDEPIQYQPVSAERARAKYEEAQQEATRLWEASGFLISMGVRSQDRLAAAERARDAAFTLWSEIAAMERQPTK
jgi:hypothetical protein